MEHPILFISVILEALGLPVPHGPVGHTFLEQLCAPYMTYTWLVMAFLFFVAKLTLSDIEMVPGKGQNFWEIVVGGLDATVVTAIVVARLSQTDINWTRAAKQVVMQLVFVATVPFGILKV